MLWYIMMLIHIGLTVFCIQYFCLFLSHRQMVMRPRTERRYWIYSELLRWGRGQSLFTFIGRNALNYWILFFNRIDFILKCDIMNQSLEHNIIIVILRFTDSLVYYAASLNAGNLSGDIFLNTFLTGLVEVLLTIYISFQDLS